ncbi:MAG: AMP-binding protein, partial [Myxococcota bacterium]
MVASSGVRWVMTAGPGAAEAMPDGVQTLDLDDPTSYSAHDQPLIKTAHDAPCAESLAYVLYTSGSTGRPKGVGVPHRAACFFLEAMTARLGWTPHTSVLAVTTLGFDIALLERWGPLVVGGLSDVASVQEASDGLALARRLATSGATAMQGTPATWRLLRDADWSGDASLQALVGGEALPVELASWIATRAGAVWNLYGPTETTVWSTAHRYGADSARDGGTVELGQPLGATRLVVLGPNGRAVPMGVWGELAIGGPGVARGYEGRGGETAMRFVPDPYASGGRLYRTGDVCRLRTDGRLEYGGRRDGQVKLRGFRIEVGEIEAHLNRQTAVATCAVVVAQERLLAFVVPSSDVDPNTVDVAALRDALKKALPAYMVPQSIEARATLPLTPNKKIDRRALAALAQVRPIEAHDYVAPRSKTEASLVAIFAEVLGLEQVSVTASFFELGGHSLLAMRVAVRIREALSVEIPLRTLFEAPTVAGLARRLDDERGARTGSRVGRTPIRAVPASERPAILPLSHAQERLWFLDQMQSGDASYSIPLTLRLDGPLDVDALRFALQQVVHR